MVKLSNFEKNVIWRANPSIILSYPKLGIFFIATIVLIWVKIKFNFLYTYIYYLYFIVAGYSIFTWLLKVLQLKTTVYTLTNERLLVRSGILRRITNELELFRVRDFLLDEPLNLRAFKLGNLVLVTSDRTTPTIELKAIPELEKLHRLIRSLVRNCWEARGVREIDAG